MTETYKLFMVNSLFDSNLFEKDISFLLSQALGK